MLRKFDQDPKRPNDVSARQTLIVMPSVPFIDLGESVFADTKMIEGLELFSSYWDGPVRCLLRGGARGDIGYGREYRRDSLPFEVQMIADDARDVGQWLDDGAVVMASADNYQDFRMADLSQSPVVFVIEYTLATRLRILWVEDIATIKKVRSSVWTLLAEYRRRKAFRRSAGIQANGRPAFRAYGDEDAGDIMYFDTRMAHAEQIGSDQIAEKRRRILEEGPLRLAFSGRLERMKGAHHLVPIAAMLDSLGVEFHLDIFGDGALRVAIETELKEAGLENRVTVHGPIPFHEALVPLLKAEIDFFLCCHMQSDPSCTYLETLSCGVPIVGYANDAFKGVLELGPAGVAAPLGDWRGIANIIKQIDADRSTLAHMATEAASVGAANTFESTFQRRVSHLRMVADRCL